MGKNERLANAILKKSRTGIQGLDEITGGGLPKGRTTLVCGTAGCGKTILACEFLFRGAMEFGEPGVFVSFEESKEDILVNTSSLGFDINKLISQKKLKIDQVQFDGMIAETGGEFDLSGLFIRLERAIEEIGARRLAIDSLDCLFSSIGDRSTLRAELRRLITWLKARGITTIITAERGVDSISRESIEEYVADCVIVLDHRIREDISTRRMQVVKYRGTFHQTNEFPFFIAQSGISVLPITSFKLTFARSKQRYPTGIPSLDDILGGKGFYRGGSILLSGTAGTGKTSVAAAMAQGGCIRGERCLFMSHEESQENIILNMQSVGLDLGRWTKKGLLQFHSVRPSLLGLESHLVNFHNLVNDFKPKTIIIDPITSLFSQGDKASVKSLVIRLIDSLKHKNITSIFTNLSSSGNGLENVEGFEISSLMDIWLAVRNADFGEGRKRTLTILKARGISHSNKEHELEFSSKGIKVLGSVSKSIETTASR